MNSSSPLSPTYSLLRLSAGTTSSNHTAGSRITPGRLTSNQPQAAGSQAVRSKAALQATRSPAAAVVTPTGLSSRIPGTTKKPTPGGWLTLTYISLRKISSRFSKYCRQLTAGPCYIATRRERLTRICSSRISVEPSARMTARSITCISSLTLPGQLCASSCSIASGLR